MIVNWKKFDGVEVQVFKSETPSSKAILFCPGFPGMGASIFEQRHAAALADRGYDVYVIHHKGTRFACGLAPASVNNGRRLQDAFEKGETHLGGGPVRMEELLDEPRPVFEKISAAYDSVHVIGNSFGALAALHVLTQEDVSADKVKTLVLLAGAQGVDDGSPECIMNRLWRPEFMNFPAITDQIEVLDTQGALETLRKLYRELPGRVAGGLAKHIALTYVVVEKDELLRLKDTQDFQAAIGGRGTIVMNDDEGFPAYGITPHYTANYRTKDLLELIRG